MDATDFSSYVFLERHGKFQDYLLEIHNYGVTAHRSGQFTYKLARPDPFSLTNW